MRRIIVFGLITLLTLAIACGSSATSTPPAAADIYQSMGAKMGSINSLHLSGLEVTEGEQFNFEIDIVLPDLVKFSGTDEEGTFEILLIGDQGYFKIPDFQGWMTQSPEETESFGDTIAFISALYTQVTDLSYIGQEIRDEVSVYHLRGTVSGEILRIVEPDDEDDNATVDFWVGVDDSLLHSAHFLGSPSGDETDATFSAFDVAVAIEAPTVTVSADALNRFFEGDINPQDLGDLVSILPVEVQNCARERMGEDTYSGLIAGTGSLDADEERALQTCLSILFGPESVEEVVEILTNAPPPLLDCVRVAIGQVALDELMSGTRMPTFDEADKFLPCFEGPQGPEPGELLDFFEGLPPTVKADLEAAGWTHDSILAFIESGEEPSLERARSLFGLLSDIPVPFLTEQATFILIQMPDDALESISGELGQQVVEELISGTRPPTGGEFLAIIELVESLGIFE